MELEDIAEKIGRLDGKVDGLTKAVDDHKKSVDGAFKDGSEKMRELRHDVDHLKQSKWKQWIAIVIVTLSLGKASPWIWKALGLPIPPP